jgi:integrase/recombinase XerD
MNRTNCMAQHVNDYLALRRAFGFRLSIAGQQLQDFARFADCTAGGKPLTLELALRWAQSSFTGKQTTAARRLLILRPFTRYLRTIEAHTEIPSNRILGPAQYRHIPHIYTDEEIRTLLEAASTEATPGPALSTYLGHVKITDTYWCVTGIPELMNTVSARFERYFCGNKEGHHGLG